MKNNFIKNVAVSTFFIGSWVCALINAKYSLSKLSVINAKYSLSKLSVDELFDELNRQLDELEKETLALEMRLDKLEFQINDSIEESPIVSNQEFPFSPELLPVYDQLNVSEDENSKYLYSFSIGDAVNLIDENIPIYTDIYSLSNNENALHSYYEISEVRLIQTIILQKDNIVIEVDNMDDYEMFSKIGFVVTGYGLVNRYSLNQDDLVTELRCNKEYVKIYDNSYTQN